MRKCRVAILGQGRSGRMIHGEYFLTEDAKKLFQVVAVVDAIGERREKSKALFGCDAYEEYQQLLDRRDIDLVVNSSFSHMHYKTTKDLLEHGFSVVCEKPATKTAEELKDLIRTAKKAGKLFTIFQQSRFAPYYKKIKEIIDSGVLGELFEVDIEFNGYARRWDWQTLQSFNGGNLYNTGPHPMDQALNILDMYDGMPSVFCRMGRALTFGDAEDYCKVILTAPGKPLIDLSISSCDGYSPYTYRIQASKGALCGTMGKINWKYYDQTKLPEQKLTKEPLTDANGNPGYCSEKLEWITEEWVGEAGGAFNLAVKEYYEMIYNALFFDKPLTITPEQVVQQIAVIEECHRQNPLSRIE